MEKYVNESNLRAFLQDEGYTNITILENTLKQLVSLKGKPAELLYNLVHKGIMPTFAPIEEIDQSFLRDRLQMKSPAIIIAYAMLLDDPQVNGTYLKRLADEKVIFKHTVNTGL